MNRILKYMDSWKEPDEKLLQFSHGNKNVLDNKHYLKLKHMETKLFLQNTKKKSLTNDEKVWHKILQVGNRQLEKQLYPNRFVRYFRRAINNLSTNFKARRESRLEYQHQPSLFKSISQPRPQSVNVPKSNLKNEMTEKPIARITPKNKYAAVQNLKINKGLSLKH